MTEATDAQPVLWPFALGDCVVCVDPGDPHFGDEGRIVGMVHWESGQGTGFGIDVRFGDEQAEITRDPIALGRLC